MIYHQRVIFYLLIFILFIEIFATIAGIFIFGSLLVSLLWGSPYMGIPNNIIQDILSFGGLSENDTLYDLGAGDARVTITAQKHFGPKKIIGYEISPWPYLKGVVMIKKSGLVDKIQFERKNIFEADLSDATFIYMYLYTSFINERVAPKLIRELKSGTKIISCSSPVDTLRHKEFELIKTDLIGPIHVYLYRRI